MIPQRKSTQKPRKQDDESSDESHPTPESTSDHKASEENKRTILEIPHTDTPMEAFKKLIEAGVQSAPVRDMSTEDHAIIGMLDLRDLVSIVVLAEEEAALTAVPPTAAVANAIATAAAMEGGVTTAGSSTPPVSPLLSGRSVSGSRSPGRRPLSPRVTDDSGPAAAALAAAAIQSSNTLAYLGRVFNSFSANTRAVDHRPQDVSLRYLALRNRCVVALSTDPLLSVVDVIAGSWDVHRVLVVEPSSDPKAPKKIIDIFSPSDIVKLLAAKYARFALPQEEGKEQEIDAAGKELNQSVDALRVGVSPVLTVSADDTMLHALRLMNHFQISGLGVVDEEGRLIGNTSGSDLKLYLREPRAEKLQMPVLEFVNEVRRASSVDRSPAVSVSPSSSFLTVLSKLAATKMHRVFVCDPITRKPLAVIAVEDIVTLIHRGIPDTRVQREFKIPRQLQSGPGASPSTTATAGAGVGQLALPGSSGTLVNSGSGSGRSLFRPEEPVKEEEGIQEDAEE